MRVVQEGRRQKATVFMVFVDVRGVRFVISSLKISVLKIIFLISPHPLLLNCQHINKQRSTPLQTGESLFRFTGRGKGGKGGEV
jgi:hypothetical protein